MIQRAELRSVKKLIQVGVDFVLIKELVISELLCTSNLCIFLFFFFSVYFQSFPLSLNRYIYSGSVQFSRSIVSDSLQPHESQHARPSCPSPPPGVHSDLRPSSQSCHPAISSSVIPFSSCPQSLPASESFPVSQLLA